MKRALRDLPCIIRSKTSGPFELTLDLLFQDPLTFERVRNGGSLSKASIARLYAIDEGDVLSAQFFEPAHAYKATIKRPIVSGTAGDTDVFGAQQHIPLLNLEVQFDPHG